MPAGTAATRLATALATVWFAATPAHAAPELDYVQTVVQDTAFQDRPHAAVAPSGDAVVVWNRLNTVDGPDRRQVLAAFRAGGATFGAPVQIDEGPVSQEVAAAQVVMDPGGRAVAVWTALTAGGAREVRAAARPAGAGRAWSSPQVVDAGPEPVKSIVALAADPSGGVLVLYSTATAGDGRNARIAFRPAGDSTTFAAPVTVGAGIPVGAGFAADGRAVIVTATTGPQVVVRERGPGVAGAIGPAMSSPAPAGIGDAALVVGPGGESAVTAYTVPSTGNSEVTLATRPSGAAFSSSWPLTTTLGRGFVPTAVGFDAAGMVASVWLNYGTPSTYEPQGTSTGYGPGKSSPPTQTLAPPGRFANGAEINVRRLAGGELLAAWGRDRRVEYAARPSGVSAVFGATRAVPGTGPGPGDVHLATDGADDPLLTFTSGGEGRVQVAMPAPARDRAAPRLITDLTPPRRTLDPKGRLVIAQAFDEAGTVTPQLVLRLPSTTASAARVVTVRGKRTTVRAGRASTFRFTIPRAHRAYVRAQARNDFLATVSFRARDPRGNARRHIVDVAVRR